MLEVTVGNALFALCNKGGDIHAISGLCLHQDGPLAQGNFVDGRVICPWHAWEYDCRTGECSEDPSLRLPTYETKVEGSDILLRVP